MTDNFDRAIAFVLKWEGGYVNDPRDPEGETNFSISIGSAAHKHARRTIPSEGVPSERAHPSVDIKALTEDAAKEIYRKDYWIKAGCDKLEWPLCLVHFDTAVNMGCARATDFKNRASREFTTSWAGMSVYWTDYLFLRIEHYNKLNKPEYLKGWINRVIDLWRTGKAQRSV